MKLDSRVVDPQVGSGRLSIDVLVRWTEQATTLNLIREEVTW